MVLTAHDWDLYRCLKAQGRLNLLCRLSESCASWLQNDAVDPDHRPKVVPFVSRAMHLAWRERWKQGRFVRLAWTTDERAALVRQDEIFRDADLEWERRHPPAQEPAVVLQFPQLDDEFVAGVMRPRD
jgi:hypothetical protein